MITLDYLQHLNGKVCYKLKSPEIFGEAGYYPTRYCAVYSTGQDIFRIILDKFSWFEGE